MLCDKKYAPLHIVISDLNYENFVDGNVGTIFFVSKFSPYKFFVCTKFSTTNFSSKNFNANLTFIDQIFEHFTLNNIQTNNFGKNLI